MYNPTRAAINAPRGSPGPAYTIAPSTSTLPARILLANAPIIPQVAADILVAHLSQKFHI